MRSRLNVFGNIENEWVASTFVSVKVQTIVLIASSVAKEEVLPTSGFSKVDKFVNACGEFSIWTIMLDGGPFHKEE